MLQLSRIQTPVLVSECELNKWLNPAMSLFLEVRDWGDNTVYFSECHEPHMRSMRQVLRAVLVPV